MKMTSWIAALGFTLSGATSFADAPRPKADADMQAVLDELAALGGKPIETVKTAEELVGRDLEAAFAAAKKVSRK